MKKPLIIIVSVLLLVALVFLGYKSFYKPAPPPEDLKSELMLTEDDGGQVDFDLLTQDAVGL